jgi:cytosine permease
LWAHLAALAPPHRPWYLTIGPAFLGLFVWAPFFDQLWVADRARHGPLWLFASAVLGPLLCYFVFLQTASWGFRAGRRLGVVAASTFGALGSEWITGVAIALANVVWYAVAIDFAVDATLLGLRACGLLGPASLEGWSLGALHVKSPVFLCTALFWIYITGMAVLLRLTGVVVALMKVYAPIALLLLTAVGFHALTQLGSLDLGAASSATGTSGARELWQSGASALQITFGFFAIASLAGVDWGAVARTQREVILGGLTGIFAAGVWTSIMSLLAVAGASSSLASAGSSTGQSASDPVPFSFRWAVFHGMGGVPAGVVLVLFGLAALAPACYSAWSFSEGLSAHRPLRRASLWTWIGGGAAYALVATSCAGRLGLVASAVGDVFAPAAGALCGDRLRARGLWRGLRPGINPAGVIAWTSGCALAGALEAASALDPDHSAWFQPASLYGFLVSAVAYCLLAGGPLERPIVALPPSVGDR